MTQVRTGGFPRIGWPTLILIIGAAIYVAPALHTTENATIYLGDCRDDSCALQGDLTRNLFTRDYELTQADDSTVVFSPEQVAMMTWPAPGEDGKMGADDD